MCCLRISIGLFTSGRFAKSELIPYIIAQVLGGIAGAAILYVIATGQAGFDVAASEFAELWAAMFAA